MVRKIDRSVVLAFLTTALAGGTAQAHIDVDAAGSHMSRNAGSSLKTAPCGTGNSSRGTNIYTYRPGATINVSLTETIPHPGYFRIAFDADGNDDFVIPSGTDGMGGNCGPDPACGPGKSDFCNNDAVLLDNIDPHASASLYTQRTWSVTLPNVECDNCTLQVIQVMNDLDIHQQPYPADDIYYHCIDLVLSNDAPEVSETPVQTEAMVCSGGGQGGGGQGGGGMVGSGGSTGGGMTNTGGVPAGTGGTGAVPGSAGEGATGGGVAGQGGGLMGSGGATGTAATTGTGSDSGSDSGCSLSAPGTGGSTLWMLPALAWLLRRRRSPAR